MESSSSSSSLAAAANTNSTSSATSELFICFTSRLSSSSSMKLSSKSILSPGRARDSSQISLSSSLSRRLKNSGSLKGGQASPMFPTAAGKKRSGCAFENPEPSSPKVTCIGQVRVKTKKQGKKMRSRSAKRRSNNGGGGEASFRRMEKEKKNKEEETTTQKLEENRTYNHSDSTNNNHHNQKWTICEALRAFGAEFNCFLPCRSSCTTAAAEEKENGKADKRISTSSANGRSCGAVFARWLVALQDGEGKRREIELVVGEDEEEREREERERSVGKSLRRRVFEGIEFKEEEIRKSCKYDGEGEEEEEEKARVSICIPPKNALLLMRCRSDPVKMAALANRFWDPPPKDDDDEDDDQKVNHEQEVCEDGHHGGEAEAEVEELAQAVDRDDLHQQPEMWECERKSVSSTTELVEREEDREESEQMKLDRKEDVVEEAAVEEAVMEDENEENPKRISTDDQVVVDVGGLWDEAQEVVEPAEEKDCEQHQRQEDNGGDDKEEGEEEKNEEEEKNQELDHAIQSRQELQEQNTDLSGLFSDETFVDLEDKEKVEEEEHVQDGDDDSHCQEEEQKIEEEAEEEVAEGSTAEEEEAEEEATEPETREEKTGREDPKEEREMGSPGLPDCLLLMMCEPKLSMEVSKETWVCSTDFIRWLPERRRVNPKKASEEPKKRPNAAAAAVVDGPQVMQPPRSSCSFPVTGTAVPESMASVIEQKLVGTKPPYEPFVLKRCKSEPMRSAAKLAPDACFWKNRKLEPHRPATLGVGAAGVGF